MDNIQQFDKLELDQSGIKHLNSIRKWTMFFSVLAFIFLGMMIIFSFTAGAFLSILNPNPDQTVPKWIIFALIFAFIIIYFFPAFFLLRFSTHARTAVKNVSSDELTRALRYLRSFYSYLGVLVIVMLCFYVLVIVIAGSSIALLNNI
ncbi:MAG TPA: hypothetical protein VK155_12610 [Bacteroidales bacterium]|jgi:uncharacterized membrane protein YjgN (DUF898 family)|nr:hypothetical protein [Bacteroidales bacterium]